MSLCITGEYNISYLHIPKTAGTSILSWLIDNKGDSKHVAWETHPKLSEVRLVNPNNFSFTVVRNPWDRMVSSYHYMKNISLKEGSSWLKLNNITEENFPTFDTWVNNISQYATPDTYWFGPHTSQVEWIDCNIDLILRYENLSTDFEWLQRTFNTSASLPHIYNSGRTNYRDYYTDETRQIVAQLNAEDIDTWKYQY
jgi:hypothetical protein